MGIMSLTGSAWWWKKVALSAGTGRRSMEQEEIKVDIKITIKERKEIRCPDCGKLVATSDVRSESSCGSEWKKLLESFGYYGPRKERYENEDYDWYAKLREPQKRRGVCNG